MVKKLLVFLLTFVILNSLFLILNSYPVFAVENFTTAYDVTYDIDEAGIAHGTMHVSLTNTTSDYYAASYKIHIGFDEILNVKATDAKGAITPNVTKTDDGNTITLTFNDKVVGKDKTLKFTLTFDTPEIAERRGSIWGVNIPGIANQEEFSAFQVKIRVPPSFGKPVFSKPSYTGESLTFTKKQLGEAGISIAFGEKQGYHFNLTYHLRNKNVFPIKTEIALPPTTNYQDVLLQSIKPEPMNVTIDGDGNWLAEYYLKPSEKLDVIVDGKAYLSYTPKQAAETDEQLQEYIKEQPYWQVSNEQIQKLAQELKTPRKIYDYVVKTLSYDYSRDFSQALDNSTRLGGVGVLQNPRKAVCLEFTDLFISLARAAGIPAREVDGYAYTENDRQRPLSLVKDILHTWPEYYDREKETWIMVDPTWEKTTGGIDYFDTFDFDHLVFVRKGRDSSYPVPAGGYKYAAKDETKDVHVEFSVLEALPVQRVKIEPVMKDKHLSFLPITGIITVKNIGSAMTNPQELVVTSRVLHPVPRVLTLEPIPPFGTREIPVIFDSLPFLTNTSAPFTIQVGSLTYEHRIQIMPFILPSASVIGGIIFGILILIISIITFKSGRIPIPRRK